VRGQGLARFTAGSSGRFYSKTAARRLQQKRNRRLDPEVVEGIPLGLLDFQSTTKKTLDIHNTHTHIHKTAVEGDGRGTGKKKTT
jgi:hypothetical protein